MLLTIAGVISAIAIMNAVLPAVSRSTNAVTTASNTVDERIKTDISVIYAVGELTATSSPSWVDTNSNLKFDFFVWVKNVGDRTVDLVSETDVFFGQPGDIARIPHADDAGASYPQWDFSVENATEWSESTTIKVTVTFEDGCPSCLKPAGNYFVKVITANGVATEKFFSI